MKIKITLLLILFCIACAQTEKRIPEVVAAEQIEREKPLLFPPGGLYLRAVEVTTRSASEDLEYSAGRSFKPLTQDTIQITETTELIVRERKFPDIGTMETYTITQEFPPLAIIPAPGKYQSGITVSATTLLQNGYIEIGSDGVFSEYDPQNGIPITASTNLVMRQCVDGECSEPAVYTYEIQPSTDTPPPVTSPQALSSHEVQNLINLAAHSYNQTLQPGLPQQMDEAKLLVVQNPNLIANAALRQRFLSQDNTVTAAESCTIVSRYLYTMARRLTLRGHLLPALPDFPHYYIRHIVTGDITVDSGGRNFVWVVNGPALVTPYLPKEALSPFLFSRGASYPTDGSLIDKLHADAPLLTLLRDGPSGNSHTHTFFAVQAAGGYAMVDTYFTPFNGIELKASAGRTWPYAYRFGPAGSRYLHIVYGY